MDKSLERDGIVVVAIIVGLVGAQQNLCGTRVRNPQFVQDWSACRSYLFCNFNETNHLVSVHQLMCPQGHVFNEQLQKCDGTGATVCDNSRSNCPAFGTVMIADRYDPMCMRFHLCANGQLIENAGMCMSGVFNRNFGTCTPATASPCVGVVDGYCPPSFTGFAPVWGSCTSHVFCQAGVIQGFFECPAGLHFSQMMRNCDIPAMANCPFA